MLLKRPCDTDPDSPYFILLVCKPWCREDRWTRPSCPKRNYPCFTRSITFVWITWKRFVRKSCSRYSLASCWVMMCHFPIICLSIAASFPRRGPGFQLQTLSLVCSVNRLGTSLLNWYHWQDGECFLAGASRNAAKARVTSTMLCLRTVSGSAFAQAEKPSRMTTLQT